MYKGDLWLVPKRVADFFIGKLRGWVMSFQTGSVWGRGLCLMLCVDEYAVIWQNLEVAGVASELLLYIRGQLSRSKESPPKNRIPMYFLERFPSHKCMEPGGQHFPWIAARRGRLVVTKEVAKKCATARSAVGFG
eukprot:1161267-Pelagomonas_calceolata.AAC.8